MYRERYWRDSVFDAISSLSDIAAEAGLTLVGLALRWLLSREAVGSVLLGASSAAQLSSNLQSIAGPPLDDEVMSKCDQVWETLRGDAPAYGH